jgi:uncharacterized damage-inducible protein DinB
MTPASSILGEIKAQDACMRTLADAAEGLLAQCEALLAGVDDASLSAMSEVMPGGSIGKHLRHLLDHYKAMLAGLEPGARVEYDKRSRDVEMERSAAAALREVAAVRGALGGLRGLRAETAVRVLVMADARGAEVEVRSTLARELAFATHHAVHHQAMIGTIARGEGRSVPEDFGKAPSTVHHEKSLKGRTA